MRGSSNGYSIFRTFFVFMDLAYIGSIWILFQVVTICRVFYLVSFPFFHIVSSYREFLCFFTRCISHLFLRCLCFLYSTIALVSLPGQNLLNLFSEEF